MKSYIAPVRTGAPDDEYPERPARWDHEVAAENKRSYERQRGRVCKHYGCNTRVRYSKRVPFCSRHELTERAQRGGKPGPIPGMNLSPKVPGLRALRKARKVATSELAPRIGRSVVWVQRAERGVIGAPDDVRAKICQVLGVSEEELFAGEFKRKG